MFVPLHPQNKRNNILESSNRGVAQLVAFLVWDQAVAGSSPVTSTKREESFEVLPFFVSKNLFFGIFAIWNNHFFQKSFVVVVYFCIFALSLQKIMTRP